MAGTSYAPRGQRAREDAAAITISAGFYYATAMTMAEGWPLKGETIAIDSSDHLAGCCFVGKFIASRWVL